MVLALTHNDSYSGAPLLEIVRKGENLGVVKRSFRTETEPLVSPVVEVSSKMTIAERIEYFKNQLDTKNIEKILSAGFKNYRNRKISKENRK